MIDASKIGPVPSTSGRQSSFLTMTMVLFGIVLASVVVILFASGALTNPVYEMYMLPWIGLVAVVVAAPAVYLAVKGEFEIFNPIIFAGWSFFFPAFVVGSLFLATHLSWPSFIHLIPDLEYYLPLALVYVALGFAGLVFGFFLPPARKFGRYLAPRLPNWDWQPEELLLPGVILVMIGLVLSLASLALGVIGYQQVEAIAETNGLVYFLSLVGNFGSFILWFAIFKTRRRDTHTWIVVGLLVLMMGLRVIMAGNRGSLLQLLIGIGLAYFLSGRRLTFKHGVIFGGFLAIALVVGMAYGTTFRNLKGNETRTDIFNYFSISVAALEKMSNDGVGTSLETAGYAIGERFDATSSLGVVVANYEKLEPYESSYHLSNNILNSLLGSLIPRFLWKDKPQSSDARAYSQLYFDYGENSFAITVMGDLLRNFGPFGVPIGMIMLGGVLAIVYTSLIADQPVTAWRAATYFMLLSSVSYEGFFDSVFPSIVRFGAVAILSVLIVKFVCGARRRMA